MQPMGSAGGSLSVSTYDISLNALVMTIASSGLFDIDMSVDFSKRFKAFNAVVV